MWQSYAGSERHLDDSSLARERYELFKQAILNTRTSATGNGLRRKPDAGLVEDLRRREERQIYGDAEFSGRNYECNPYNRNDNAISESIVRHSQPDTRSDYLRGVFNKSELEERNSQVEFENAALKLVNFGKRNVCRRDEVLSFRQNEKNDYIARLNTCLQNDAQSKIGYATEVCTFDNNSRQKRDLESYDSPLPKRHLTDRGYIRYERDEPHRPKSYEREALYNRYEREEPYNKYEREKPTAADSGAPNVLLTHKRVDLRHKSPTAERFYYRPAVLHEVHRDRERMNVRDRSTLEDNQRTPTAQFLHRDHERMNLRDRSPTPENIRHRSAASYLVPRNHERLNLRDRSSTQEDYRVRPAVPFVQHRDVQPHSADNVFGYRSEYRETGVEFSGPEQRERTSRFSFERVNIEYERKGPWQMTRNDRNRVVGSDENKIENYEYDDLPRHLTRLFEDDYCGLCDAKLNTADQADGHYNGKTHRRKLNNYMREWYIKNDLPCPAKFLPPSAKLICNEILCKVCKVKFNTSEQLVSHYKGEKHRIAKENLKRQLEEAGIEKLDKTREKNICGTCCVETSSEEQLQAHLIGQKHKKMELRLLEMKTIADSSKVSRNLPKPKDVEKSSSPSKSGTEMIDLTDTDPPEKGISEESVDKNGKKYECKICGLKKLTKEQYDKHRESTEHQQELNLKNMQSQISSDEEKVECTICCLKNLTKSELAKHVQSYEHKKEESLKKKQMMISFEQEKEASKQFICDLCNVIVKAELKEAHIKTKAHIKALKVVDSDKAKELEELLKMSLLKRDKFVCDVCELTLPDSNAYSQHIDSKKHKKKVAESKLNTLFPVDVE